MLFNYYLYPLTTVGSHAPQEYIFLILIAWETCQVLQTNLTFPDISPGNVPIFCQYKCNFKFVFNLKICCKTSCDCQYQHKNVSSMI